MAEVNLATLVEEVVGDLSFDDSLDIKLGIGELPTVWGNSNLLRRLFINLINNAVKYNDKKEIVVNIGVRNVHEKSIARFAEVFVEDNGPGIPKDEIKDVFTMFSRGSAAKPDKDGIGIGLAIVHRIIEIHFGKITVESEVGKGTRFVMLLPLEKIDFIN